MTIEEAIKTAMEFEVKVRDLYRSAMEEATDALGERIFGVLAEEEQNHLDYLRSKLHEWKETGEITAERLNTAIPPKEAMREGMRNLKPRARAGNRGGELRMLTRALEVEVATSNFYKKMVREIEEGHLAIVRAEIDYLSRTGYWFDFKEFDME